MTKLRLDVWSDIACPWCYVGKRRLEAALARFPHRDQVELVWRSFELDPGAPPIRDDGQTYAERLGRKYRKSTAEAQGMLASMTATAAADGLDLRFDRVRAGSTFDGHRLLHLAAEHGLQDALKERLLHAYFTDGQAIGDRASLRALAVEVGLDGAAVDAALAGDGHAADVRADERLAQELGISGVPFFVLDGRLGVSGAQPAEVLLGALTEAWTHATGQPASAEGETCGPDGCA
jgi:predicted DsbA family dithiol-disulfide isomerase